MEAPDQHVAWNTIASSFSKTRDAPWPVVQQWLATKSACRILDVMSGNGRHGSLARRMGFESFCADWAEPLCKDAAADGNHAVRSDARVLPFLDDSFDAAMYIAGLHGIPEPNGRAQSLREVRRVVRTGGEILFTVWSRNAKRFQDFDDEGPVDCIVPWRRDGHDVARTYHLYTVESLTDALEDAGFDVLDCHDGAVAGPSPDNIVATVRVS